MAINAKYLNENLKKGWDTKDFATDLGIEEAEFIALLEKTFVSRTLNGFRRRLKVNESQKKKRKKKPHDETKKVQEVVEVVEFEEVIVDSDDSGDNDATVDATVCESKHPSLYELEEMRKSISSQLCQMEAKIIASRGEKNAAFDKLAAEEFWISKIIEELNAHKKNAEEIAAAINTATKEISQLQTNKKMLREQLSKIADLIAQAKKVTIYAVSQEDTVIESESELPNYDTTYDPEIFNKIVASDFSELSTVRQLKYVASLIKYCHMLTDMNRTYEIIFENSGSEKLFFEFV